MMVRCKKTFIQFEDETLAKEGDLVDMYGDYEGICFDYPSDRWGGINSYYPDVLEILTYFELVED